MLRTAVHFGKEDPVDQVPALEQAGRLAGSDRGALAGVQRYSATSDTRSCAATAQKADAPLAGWSSAVGRFLFAP